MPAVNFNPNSTQEDHLRSAVTYFLKHEGFVSLCEVSSDYNIPKTTLYNRIESIKKGIEPKKFKLDENKQKLLIESLTTKFEESGEAIKRREIVAEAVRISGQEKLQPSSTWIRNNVILNEKLSIFKNKVQKKTEVVKYVTLHELELMEKQLTEQADIAGVLAIIRMIKGRKSVKKNNSVEPMNNYEEQLLQEQQELHQVHHAEEEPQLLQPPTHQEKQVPPHMELEEQLLLHDLPNPLFVYPQEDPHSPIPRPMLPPVQQPPIPQPLHPQPPIPQPLHPQPPFPRPLLPQIQPPIHNLYPQPPIPHPKRPQASISPIPMIEEKQEAIKYSIEDDGLEGFRTYIDNDAEWNSAEEETFMEKDEDIADHELNIDFE